MLMDALAQRGIMVGLLIDTSILCIDNVGNRHLAISCSLSFSVSRLSLTFVLLLTASSKEAVL